MSDLYALMMLTDLRDTARGLAGNAVTSAAGPPGRPERHAADAVSGREEFGAKLAATYPVAPVTR